jgi:chromate transporter
MREENVYLALVTILAPLSIAAIGGATGIYAPLQHETVEIRHWINAREFIELFAVSRLAPGPGSMLAPLIAWKVAGIGGAILATIALYLPSSILCYGAARVWHRYRGKPWHKAIEAGLTPVAAGLIFAGIVSLLQLGGMGPLSWVTVVLVALLLTWKKRLHPLPLIGCGALLFFLLRLSGV